MRVEIKYQVFTATKKYKTAIWRYGTEGEAEEQYGYCCLDKDLKIVELQQVLVLKQKP